ncbi:hypothetical protein IF651_12320 [Cellulosimicrobium arenosum]|uniref:Fic/DOC N-terminal domain-containing protein n=1 Tax=Cellulosimicrobium arenosum TaxID=2708133 RepID=A0A927J0Y6_9MICO|nr:hypothetical protein [Cellulosimicrobium arenosum]
MSRLVGSVALEAVSDAAAVIARIAQRLRERPQPILYATLVRSESISSSWVEGLRETPRNIMVAQLQERDPGLSGHQFDRLDTARAILGNLDSVRDGVETLRGPWSDQAIHDIHRTIAPHVHRTRTATDGPDVSSCTAPSRAPACSTRACSRSPSSCARTPTSTCVA